MPFMPSFWGKRIGCVMVGNLRVGWMHLFLPCIGPFVNHFNVTLGHLIRIAFFAHSLAAAPFFTPLGSCMLTKHALAGV